MTDLLHELDTVSRVHPDPVLRQLLQRAHHALYHLALEASKAKHEADHAVDITVPRKYPKVLPKQPPNIPFVDGARDEDRL
jgi:hypothetical protein